MQFMKRAISVSAFVLAALVFCGCAGLHAPNTSAMIPNDSGLVFKSTGKMLALGKFNGPRVRGGNTFIGSSSAYLVTTFDLRDVLAQSLKNSHLFSGVEMEPSPKVDYVLNASIVGQRQSAPGSFFHYKSTLIVKYELIRKATGAVVFSKVIHGKCSVSAGQALVGSTRLRLAVQGAVKDNVRQLLEAISKLQL